MSVRTLVVLALAIVCGGSSAAGVFLMRGNAPEKPETVSVVMAARDIARGEVVTEQVITTREWPVGYEPPNAITKTDDVLNRTAMSPIMAGEAILQNRIADPDAGRGLAALIPEGQRAYTIQASHVGSNVAGFVMPGNRVDVLLTLRGGNDDTTGGGSSTTLLQAVEILAVDQRLDAPSENRVEKLRSVTLLVTPDQAALLDLGHNMGTLALSLRNPSDVAKAETEPATVNVLRFTQKEPNVEPNVEPTAAEPEKTETLKPVIEPTALVATAPVVERRPVVVRKPKQKVLQTFTLRGRSSGRIMIRANR